jgi:transcriptional regulator with XRE-family HTH domain
MKTFNEKQILKHKTTFAFVAKTMTALAGGSHVYTEDELRSSHLEGKDAALFFKALRTPYLNNSQELRFWVYSTDLKALRESFNYTQRELAKHLGISPSVLCHLEKKDTRHISDDIIQKVYDFYQHPINKKELKPEVVKPTKKSTVEDAHFAEVRRFCINELSDKLKGQNRKELAKKFGVSPSYFSKCIHGFDQLCREVTPPLEKIYNYFNSEPIEEPVSVKVSEPVNTNHTLTFKDKDAEYIISLIDREIDSFESQLQDALAEHDYFKVSAIAAELNKLSILKENKLD